MRRRVSYFFVFVLFVPFASRGEEKSLGEVKVYGEQAGDLSSDSKPLHDSAAFTTVITSGKFEGRRTNLSEVLEESTGVRIRRLGGLDDFATVSIRGSTSEQVSIYLDGIPLGQGVGGAVNIASIPTDQIERVEVYKGAAPAWFGSSSIGGVVNIITRMPKKRETQISQSYGSFRTYEGALSQSQKFTHASYEVGYDYSRSAGDFTFLDNNGTPFNPSDDAERKRENNAFARHNLLTKVDYDLKNISLKFQNQFFREDRGVPGIATLTSTFARLSTTRNGASFEIKKRGILSRLDIILTPFFQYQKTAFSDPRGEISLGPQQTDDDAFQYGSGLRGHLLTGRHQRWGLTTEYRGEQFLPQNLAGATSFSKSVRNAVTIGLEDEIFLLDERIVLNPSIRSEHILTGASRASSSLHPVSGKIGILYRPLEPREALTLKSNFSRSWRIPSFSELFGNTGSVVGNPDLRPERGLNADIGALLNFQELALVPFPMRLEVSYYFNQIDDLIQFIQTSQFVIKPQNLSRARIQGIEASLSLTPWNFLDISGNYTFQWARDASGLPGLDGKFLPGRPRHEINSRAAFHHPAGDFFTEVNFLDQNFLDTQNILQVNGRLLWNAGVSVRFLKKFTASLEVKNILNNRVSDLVGFPLPGRSYYGKVEVKI